MYFVFTPWRNLIAYRDRRVSAQAMRQLAEEMDKEFVKRIKSPPKTGRIYRSKRGMHQASAPGEFPANETGRLAASVRHDSSADHASVVTNMLHFTFTRNGTRK